MINFKHPIVNRENARHNFTKVGIIALAIPTIVISMTTPVAAETTKETKTIKQENNVKELDTMIVTAKKGTDNRLNRLAGTQTDPTYKSDFKTLDPVTINTISQQDLDTVKFTDPYQVLARVPGVSLSRNLRFPNGGRSYTVNLMDGISVRDPLRGKVTDIINFDQDEIQRIEVTKGPASALFPSNAFGGVINVITKDPPEKAVRRVWMEGGANDTNHRLRGGGSMAGKLTDLGYSDLGYRLSFNIWDVPSWRTNTMQSREVGSGKLAYQINDDSKLTFRGEYIHSITSEGNSLTGKQFKDNSQQASGYSSYSDTDIMTYYLDYENKVSEDGFLKASYGVRNDKGFGFASFSGPADNNYLDMDGKVAYRHHFNPLDSYFTIGLETVNGNDNTKSYNNNLANPLKSGDKLIQHFSVDKFQASPFSQLEVSPLPWMHLTAGARYDDITYDADNKLMNKNTTSHYTHFSPKSGLTLDLPWQQKLWFNYSFGFAPPTPNLLFTNTIPDANLKSEIAENREVGLRGSLLESFNQKLDYEIAYYNTDVTDYIVNQYLYTDKRTRLDVNKSVNAGKVNLQGLETSIRYSPIKYLRFEVAHTYSVNKYRQFIDGVNDYSGNIVAQSPTHNVNARMTISPIKKLNIEFEAIAMTDYYTNANNNLDPSGTYQHPVMLNLRTSYEVGPAELWLHALNLTNAQAARVASAARGTVTRAYSAIEDPLTIYGGVAFKF